MRWLDNAINRITLYKLVLYGLGVLAAVAVALSFLDVISFSPGAMLGSLAIFVWGCYGANLLFAKLYGASVNAESSVITGLILFFLFVPPRSWLHAAALLTVAVSAMAFKYLVAWRERHLFNPAAFAAVIMGTLGVAQAGWWVANASIVPFVVLLAVVIVRKIHRFPVVLTFLAVAIATLLAKAVLNGNDLAQALRDSLTVTPLVFMGSIMLTEPLTMPPRRDMQLAYAGLIGVLTGSGLHGFGLSMTPDFALVAGNAFGYLFLQRKRLSLRLVSREMLAPDTYRFRFRSAYPFRFIAGQYMEVTLPHDKTDVRGNRRTFTIASAPAEGVVEFGIRMPQPGSSFKQALLALPEGGALYGVQVAGDFILPKDTSRKLLFIAGGIGITPFRSMVADMVSRAERRDVVVVYAASSPQHFVYQDILQAAAQYGVRVILVLSAKPEDVPSDWQGETGFVSAELLQRNVADVADRLAYVSGPDAMVRATKSQLRAAGVPRWHSKTDYFAGY